jgi:hypothetical protein
VRYNSGCVASRYNLATLLYHSGQPVAAENHLRIAVSQATMRSSPRVLVAVHAPRLNAPVLAGLY